MIAILARFPELAGRITERVPGEAVIDTPEGRRTVEVSATTLTDWQRQPIGGLILLHDITGLRAVEAQLLEQERALAGAQERERLARELHDGLAQDLWLAKLKSGRLATQPELGSESRAIVEELTAAVDSGLDEARNAVAALRLDGNGGRGLRELLAGMLRDFEDRFGLAADLDGEADLPALEPRAEAEALRIIQEALTNVRRHADATVVRVRVARDERGLVLQVRDNGRGFDPGATGDEAYGLAGMRERAALIGGTLEIESAPRRGTTVRVVLPAAAHALATASP